MNRIKKWIIKKLVGKTPVIMNVTLVLDQPIMGGKSEGIFEDSYIKYSKRCLEELGYEVEN
ncbi:hypothetical protein CHH55_16980 [Niallia circulans]|jgi:hypothetical protein|uniref:hypothetical protein n=1 Tax=Niallia circulans TaxID=1397 RepID=UPI000BA57785|nr:hypothetical protein [Niallia circulans]PAD86664.1 hypothetical protein CHH55_16980 [Niallia circulans]